MLNILKKDTEGTLTRWREQAVALGLLVTEASRKLNNTPVDDSDYGAIKAGADKIEVICDRQLKGKPAIGWKKPIERRAFSILGNRSRPIVHANRTCRIKCTKRFSPSVDQKLCSRVFCSLWKLANGQNGKTRSRLNPINNLNNTSRF